MADPIQLVTSYRTLLTSSTEEKTKKLRINTNPPTVSDNPIMPNYLSSLKSDDECVHVCVCFLIWTVNVLEERRVNDKS